MREFVVVGHEAPTTAEFSLDDLPGAGRLDVLCRCVTAAFRLSHDFRDEVRVRLVLDDEYVVRFEGAELRHLRPDERSAGSLIHGALEARDGAIGAMEATASPGVHVGTGDLESAVEAAAETGTLVELHADGDPVVDLKPPGDIAFVLSDHRDFTGAEAAVLERMADERRSLGPEPIHADDAVTVAHNYLDTGGFEAY